MSSSTEVSSSASSFSHYGAQAMPPRRIRVIGVPLDLGASRRGVDMGPSAVRVAGLEARLEALGHQVTDGGNIRVEIAETQTSGKENAHYLKQIAQTCTRTAEAVVKTLEEGLTPLVLGGDHSVAAGQSPAWRSFYRRKERRSVWFGSMPTPTSTRRKLRLRATFTVCRSPRCWGWTGSLTKSTVLPQVLRKMRCWWACGISTRPSGRTSAAPEWPKCIPWPT